MTSRLLPAPYSEAQNSILIPLIVGRINRNDPKRTTVHGNISHDQPPGPRIHVVLVESGLLGGAEMTSAAMVLGGGV